MLTYTALLRLFRSNVFSSSKQSKNYQQENVFILILIFFMIEATGKSANLLTPRRRTLQTYSKMEKTTAVEYSIIQSLLAYLQTNPQKFCPQFYSLYENIVPEMRKLTLFQYLNFQLWNDTDTPRQLRDKTQFFTIISEWIISYEMKQEDLKTLAAQFSFLTSFLVKNTMSMFERVLLFEEIHEDLLTFLGPRYWHKLAEESDQEEKEEQYQEKEEQYQEQEEQYQEQEEQYQEQEEKEKEEKSAQKKIMKEKPEKSYEKMTKQQAETLIILLSAITSYYQIDIKDVGRYFSCSLILIADHSQKYRLFMQYGIKNILLANEDKTILHSSRQSEITRIALIFLQREDVSDEVTVQILKLLMTKTSKMVRFAMIVDYVKFYEYLEITGREGVLEELEDMVYFRELIIGKNQVSEAGLIVHTLGPTFEEVSIAARSRSRLMFSHEQVYGVNSLLQIQIQIEGGDINLKIFHFGDGKEKLYWRQQRTQDRRVDILLQHEGIYAVEFDNTYSWVRGKKVLYKIEQYSKRVDD